MSPTVVVTRRAHFNAAHRLYNSTWSPEFAHPNPTAEHIVVQCWRWLAPVLPAGRLVRIVLWETERNLVEYTGD